MTTDTSPNDNSTDESYTECEVCGNRPDPDRIPPYYVLSLAGNDISEESITSYPFGGELRVTHHYLTNHRKQFTYYSTTHSQPANTRSWFTTLRHLALQPP